MSIISIICIKCGDRAYLMKLNARATAVNLPEYPKAYRLIIKPMKEKI